MAQAEYDDHSRAPDGAREKAAAALDTAGSAVRDTAGGDRVQGKASGAVDTVRDKASEAAGSVRETAGEVAERVQRAPATARRQTQGNPIAAGLIAFGAGLLAASLLPATELERRAGRQVRDHADELIEPVREPLTEATHDLGDSARQAASAVAGTAKDAARTTAQSARSTAQDATVEVRDTVAHR
jgi:hypothetical protein